MNDKFLKPRIYDTLLFLALLSGPPRMRARDPLASLSAQVDWSVAVNAVVWGLAAVWVFFHLGGCLMVRRSVPRFGVLHGLAFLLVACLYLSVFVSVAPPLTFYRVSQILIAVLFGFFWLRRFGIASALKHLLAGYLLVAIAIAVCAFAAPDLVFPIEGRLRGDAIGNTGAVAAMGLITLLGYPVIKRRALYPVVVIFLGTLLILAQTRTAFAAAGAFILLAVSGFPRSGPMRSFIYFAALAAPLGIMLRWMPVMSEWLVRDQATVATMSDRIPLWQSVISVVMEQSPWIGLGFYANREITTSYNADLGTSHSAYLEMFSGGGILAFSVFCMILLIELALVSVLFLRRGRNPEVFTIAALFVATLLIGLTSEEMVIASPVSFTFWLLLSLIPMTIYQERRRVIDAREDFENSVGSRVLSATGR